MIIDYKKPYWIKYKWDVENGLESKLLKTDNSELQNFLFQKKFSFVCNFKIGEDFKRDKKAGIFGKAGQNFGLNYDSEIDSLVFEFRTNSESPEFHCLIFEDINFNVISNGVRMIIIKNNNTIKFYLNEKLIKYYRYEGEFINEYKDTPFFLGSLNPGADNPYDRCFSQVDISLFSMIKNEVNFNTLKSINKNSENVLCYYDFKILNLRNDVYDESNNFNFLELIPEEYIK